jgi:hypothetical protein
MEMNGNEQKGSCAMKSLVVVFSYHHNNTEKIANAMCKGAWCRGKNTAAG